MSRLGNSRDASSSSRTGNLSEMGTSSASHVGIADDGDVAACRGALGADGFAVGKARLLVRATVKNQAVRITYFRVWFPYDPYFWDEA